MVKRLGKTAKHLEGVEFLPDPSNGHHCEGSMTLGSTNLPYRTMNHHILRMEKAVCLSRFEKAPFNKMFAELGHLLSLVQQVWDAKMGKDLSQSHGS